MNIEALKKKFQKVTAFEWQGETVYLRKIGAKDAIDFTENIKSLAGSGLEAKNDMAATVDFHARLASKSLADESGELTLDSQEGVEALKAVNASELFELGEMVLNHSGFSGEKKSSAINNLPPTDCALGLEGGPTPTTCLSS